MENHDISTLLGPLYPEALSMGDPFLKHMLKRQIAPLALGSSIAILFTILRMAAAWGSGFLMTSGRTIGFFEDPGMYINLIAGIAVWTYFFWMPRGITQAFQGLIKNGAIGPSLSITMEARGESYSMATFLAEMQEAFGRWIWFACALVLAIAGTLVFLLPNYLKRMQIQDSWSMANPFNLTLSILWAVTGLYAALLLLFLIVASIYWLRRLFADFAVKVRPLHPDKAGGLSPLGKFSLNISYLITILGFILAAIPMARYYLANGTFGFNWTTDVILGLGIYIIAAPFAFFAPLSVAHAAMKSTKQNLLLQISQRFETEYSVVQKSLQGDVIELETNMMNLKGLHSLHELTNKFPVWPFNIENILRFITSFVSPILVVLVSTVIRNLI